MIEVRDDLAADSVEIGENMTGREILNAALAYRDKGPMQMVYVRFDLQAALEHAPNCSNCEHRFGNDRLALLESLALLPQ